MTMIKSQKSWYIYQLIYVCKICLEYSGSWPDVNHGSVFSLTSAEPLLSHFRAGKFQQSKTLIYPSSFGSRLWFRLLTLLVLLFVLLLLVISLLFTLLLGLILLVSFLLLALFSVLALLFLLPVLSGLLTLFAVLPFLLLVELGLEVVGSELEVGGVVTLAVVGDQEGGRALGAPQGNR